MTSVHQHGVRFASGPTYHRSLSEQLCPTQGSCGPVVVGVEEGQRLLLQEKEHGVNQLDVLCDVVQLRRSVNSQEDVGIGSGT